MGPVSSVSRPIIAQVTYHNMSTNDLPCHLLLFYASVSDFQFPILMAAGVVAFMFPWLVPVSLVESGGMSEKPNVPYRAIMTEMDRPAYKALQEDSWPL